VIETQPSGAVFSSCRLYRYKLWRNWSFDSALFPQDNFAYVAFIGLNPSTADEHQDDPTIRRCIRFARDWGYDAMVMLNLFAYRATEPADMKAIDEPKCVIANNDYAIAQTAHDAALTVACWGVHGEHKQRGERVRTILDEVCTLQHFGETRDGHPRHPLYLRADTAPTAWYRS